MKKRTILILTSLLLCVDLYAQGTTSSDGARLPENGMQIGGKGADGKFHFLLVGNDGAISVGGGGGGSVTPGAGWSAANNLGAANYANGQVASSTTAGTLVAARATRRSVMVKNTDAAITVYIGAATVTSANGVALKAGESVSIDTTALIQVIAASGTPTVAYMETYD